MCIKNTLSHILRGAAMGCADVVPGISGGTVAFILGIYTRLIAAISGINMHFLRDILRLRLSACWKSVDGNFTAPLAIGLILGVLFCVKIIDLPGLLTSHREMIYGLFFGLIFASSLMMLRNYMPVARCHAPYLPLGIAIIWAVLQFAPSSFPPDPITLFLSGILASSAMLLPGISGSFLLLLSGQYATILHAIADVDSGVLAPFCAGVVTGLIAMVRLINWLLTRFEQRVMLLMIGILFGSLWRIWPFQQTLPSGIDTPILPGSDTPFMLESSASMLAGMLIVFMLYRVKNKRAASL